MRAGANGEKSSLTCCLCFFWNGPWAGLSQDQGKDTTLELGNKTKQQTTLPTLALGFCMFFLWGVQRLHLACPTFLYWALLSHLSGEKPIPSRKAKQRSTNLKPGAPIPSRWSAKFWVPPAVQSLVLSFFGRKNTGHLTQRAGEGPTEAGHAGGTNTNLQS